MKKVITFVILFLSSFFTKAQYVKPNAPAPWNHHSHRGFHFEFGLGPVFGDITDNLTVNGIHHVIEFSGTGLGLEIKIGGGIQEDLVLTLDILSKVIMSPRVTQDGMLANYQDDFSISEVTYGGGLTYYLLPSDLFFSVTLGTGTFVIQQTTVGNIEASRSDFGFSYQVKVGKHWWFSSKWGVAISGGYSSTSADDSGYDSMIGNYTDELSSSRFTITASIGLR